MPPKNQIIGFWVDKIQKKKLSNNVNECFACKSIVGTQRCHIKAYIENGTNEVSNLHLLCKECHIESECIDGTEYWKWFWFKEQSNSASYLRIKNVANVKGITIKESEKLAIENVGLRTKQGLEIAKKKGVRLGNPKNLNNKARQKSIDIRVDKAKDSTNNKQIIKLVSMYIKQDYSLRKIAITLNELGMKTQKGKDFSVSTIQMYKSRLTNNHFLK